MRRLIDIFMLLALLVVGGVLWYTHPQAVRGLVRVAEDKIAPCATPLTYSVGSIDPRFGIPTSTLVADLSDAESIWEKAAGKELFQYEPSGGIVTVSLRYDSRQAATDKLQSAGVEIDRSRASYDSLKAQYDTASARVKTEQSQYDSKTAAYKRDEAAYNAAVAAANARGGATPAEYAQFQTEKQRLADEFASLKSLESTVNSDIDTVNALATTLNQLIVQLNLNVKQYNNVGAAGGEFEEGLYQLAGGVQTIDIYEYSDHVQLVRVLAHEMGHALGLEHVEDTDAIMYPVNQGTSLAATAEDLAELKNVCSAGLFSKL